MIRIMTVDVENDLRSDTCKSMEVIPGLLDFFTERKINATFFVVTSLLEKYESDIKEIARKQEIASHSHTHAWLNKDNAEFEIRQSKKVLEEYGLRCEGFRAPKFITTKNQTELLEKYGYTYDCSRASLLPGKLKFLSGKVASFQIPVMNSGLSYLKLLHPGSKFFPRSEMFYLHPWEFLEKKDLPKSDSPIKFLLKRNAGKKARKMFEEHIDREEDTWVGCREWLHLKKI